MEQSLFFLNQISKTYNQGQTVPALNLVSLGIEEGEFIVILGPSGCGKTTLLRILAGLTNPSTGEVFYRGKSISGPDSERGYLFQDPRLFPWLTVGENIGLTNPPESVQFLAEKFGLANFLNLYPQQLSGGMAKRAALARALTNEAKVLLLDEPLSNLDWFTKRELQQELFRVWREEGLTCVMVTHDVDEALDLANRIIIFTPRPGQIYKDVKLELDYPRDSLAQEYIIWRERIITWSMEAR